MALKGSPRAFLGIDIGSATIKAVELIDRGVRRELATYVYAQLPESLAKRNFLNGENEAQRCAQLIKEMLERAEVSSDTAIFSLPSDHLFAAIVALPDLSDEQLFASALFKAEELVPLGLDDVVLTVTRPGEIKQKVPIREEKNIEHFAKPKKRTSPFASGADVVGESNSVNVLITAIPKYIISRFKQIADLVGLELWALESEVFPMMRVHNAKKDVPQMFCTIGWSETSIYVTEQDSVKFTHTFDFGYQNPEQTTLNVEPLLFEARQIITNYENKSKRRLANIVLMGDGSLETNIKSEMTKHFGAQVLISNPFQGLTVRQGAEGQLSKLGPIFTVAVGLASREFGDL